MHKPNLASEIAVNMFIKYVRHNNRNDVIQRFTDLNTGKVYVSGLFRLHDEIGFPLSMALDICHHRDEIPCLMQFRADAIRAGWSPDKIERVIKEAEADMVCRSTPPKEQ